VVGIAAGETAAAVGAVLAETEPTVVARVSAPTLATPDLPSEWGGGAGVSGAR
jgi:hypothetical protein